MYIDSLVSLNIFRDDDNTIINKIPLLYYWDGKDDLIKNILSDLSFQEKYLNKLNLDRFKHLQLGYFYFEYDENDNEKYTENIINICDYLDLSTFDSKNIIYELIVKYMFKLYKVSMKTEYVDTKIYNEEIIIDIYNQIKDKYKDKLNKKVFINWIRSELINKENLNNNNSNYITIILENILKTVD